MQIPAGTIYAFDQFRLDPSRRALTRANGENIRLKPKALDTLIYLVAHPFELVDKEMLLREIWPNVAVEENNLNQHISALRRALGDAPSEQKFIATEPRRGYRFVASVQRIAPDSIAADDASLHQIAQPKPGAANRARRYLPAGAVLTVALLTFAVAIFIVLTGLDSDTTGDLGISRDESIAGTDAPDASIEARQYFDSAMDYLSRRDRLGREVSIAIRQLELSVSADPDFALAWSQLAMAHLAMIITGMDAREARRIDARMAAQRALALDSALPEAHLALSQIHFHLDNEPEAALRALSVATIDPRAGTQVWMARADFERRLGFFSQAIDSARHAASENNAARLEFEASIEVFRRAHDGAEELLERLVALYPDNAQAQRYLATIPLHRDGDVRALKALADNPDTDEASQASAGWFAALWEHDFAAAADFLDRIPPGANVRGFGAFNIPIPLARARTLRASGQEEHARELYRSMLESTRSMLADDPDNLRLQIELGEALAGSGDFEAATEIAYQARDSIGRQHDIIGAGIGRLELLTRVLIPAGLSEFAVTELDLYLSNPGPWSIEGLMNHPDIRPLKNDSGFLTMIAEHRRD